MHTIKSALALQLEASQITYWLDSKTALCWIQNCGEWKRFVQHRVNEILQLSKKHEWRHCPGEYNVADIGSRRMGALQLSEKDVWWHGPEWLSEGEHTWPASETTAAYTLESEAEEKKTAIAMITEMHQVSIVANVTIENFSSLLRLLRVTAWVCRCIYNCCAKMKAIDEKINSLERSCIQLKIIG
jgi:hypothetical protein